MGFNFGRALGGAALGGLLLPGPGMIAGGYLGGTGKDLLPEPDKPTNPGMDPKYKALVDKQQQQAQSFRNDAPEMQAQQTRAAQDQARRGIAESMSGVNKGMNKRGLLYSGVNEGQKLQMQAEKTNELAGNVANIQKNIESQAQGLEEKALGSMQQYTSQEQNLQNQELMRKIAEQQSRNTAVQSAAGGAGGVLGSIFGGVF